MAQKRIEMLCSQLQQGEVKQVSLVSAPVSAQALKRPIKVVVTGAAGNIAYSIVFMIGQGLMLGPNQPIELRLLDIPGMEDKLKGIVMELEDCAFPLLASIVPTTDYKTAFTGAEVALLIGARPRGPGMERKDLLTANAAIFSGQGKAINQYANRNIKVVVVGNPANTNALITMENAPDIPRENFTALTRLDHNRAVAQIAGRLSVPVTAVKNAIIWGNHSNTQYPDVNHGVVKNYPAAGHATPIRSAINDDEWLEKQFINTVQVRGAAVINVRKASSAASAANATVDHVRDWLLGTAPGEWVSMAVVSDGSYGVPKGLIYSFPVTTSNGNWKIVQDLKISKFSRAKMDATAAELLDEKKQALGK